MTTPFSTRTLSIALLLGAMAAAGCGSDGGSGTPTPTGDAAADSPSGNDASADTGTPPGPPQTFDYVINAITIDGTSGADLNPMTHNQGVSGFNLDGRFSGPAGSMPADCAHGDFFSTLDSDQNMGTCSAGMARGGGSCTGGVDNQLPAIASAVGGFGATTVTLRVIQQVYTHPPARVLREGGGQGVSTARRVVSPILQDSLLS